MIIEREKRYIVTSQSEKTYGVRRLCKTSFIPETNGETNRPIEFVEEMLAFNDTGAEEVTRMRDTEVRSINGWAANTQIDAITRHLTKLRTHPSFDQLIKDISQLITDIEED